MRHRLPLWLQDDSGVAATEFAGVLAPFLLFVLGIMGSGLQFFTANSLEHGVEAASRQIRTGQAQTAATPKTLADFKADVCANAGSFIKCDAAHMSIIINSWPTWAGVTQQSCMNGSNLATATGVPTDSVSTYSGGAGQVVLVTVCYKWDTAKGLYAYSPTKFSDGSVLMQASTAFRTECYNTTC